jgi:hypothetical protein
MAGVTLSSSSAQRQMSTTSGVFRYQVTRVFLNTRKSINPGFRLRNQTGKVMTVRNRVLSCVSEALLHVDSMKSTPRCAVVTKLRSVG